MYLNIIRSQFDQEDAADLVSLIVELDCPEHGLERFRVKIVKRFNMKPDVIIPKFRRKPKPGGWRCVYVGRNISPGEIRDYLIAYFRRRGMWENILSMKLKAV
jgi:hypothetical protein